MEKKEEIAVLNEVLAPRCHMKPMKINGTLSGSAWWECSVCGSTKEYIKGNQMTEVTEEYQVDRSAENDTQPEEAKENSETQIIDVEVDLSVDDLLEIGETIGILDTEEDTIVAEKKAATSMWGAKFTANQAEQKSLKQKLKNKTETRSIECHADPDYEKGVMCYVSVETDEVVHERKLTNEERQMKLFEEEEAQA